MLKKLTLLALASALAAVAQNTTITASRINYFGGQPVTGQFCAQPTDGNGHKLNVGTSTGQQLANGPAVGPMCWAISNGVLASNAIVPDTSLTQPVNACYSVVIYNVLQQQVGAYSCIQPQGSSWSFDTYVPSALPSIPALTLPQFQTNGVANQSQGVVNIVCSGCTNTGGTVNIPSSGSSTISNNTVLGNVSGVAAAAAALTVSQLSTLLGGSFDAAGAAAAAQSASLQKGSNLGDLASASTARTNLGLGSAATSNASAFDAAGAASTAQSASLQKSSNLSDLASASTARTNLGLGSAATSNTSAFDAAGAAAAAQATAENFTSSSYAPLASPALTGNPTAPTQTAGDNTTKIATDAFVQAAIPNVPVASVFGRTGAVAASSGDYSVSQVTGAAPLASPALTGNPTAPTPTTGDNSTKIATTANVVASIPANATAFTNPQTAPAFWPASKSAGPNANYFEDYIGYPQVQPASIGSPTSPSCNARSSFGTDINHPGSLYVASGTGASGSGESCGTANAFSPGIQSMNTSPGWVVENVVQVPVLPGTTAAAYQVGTVGITATVNPWTTGIGFYLSSANSVPNDWYCEYGSTYVDTGIAATAATWVRLTTVSNGSTVSWFINGTATAAGCTGVAVASMPSSAQNMGAFSATTLTASTNVFLYIDYTLFQRTLTR